MSGKPLLDISDANLKIVRDILRRHVPEAEVWAFGSRANWTAKEFSDLDLCIVTDKPVGLTVLGALAEDFADSELPWKVDIVDWAATNQGFRKIIEKHKLVVLKPQPPSIVMDTEQPEYTLGELCLLIADCPHATPKWTDQGVVVLRNQNIKGGRLDLSAPSYTDEEHYLGRIRRAKPQVGDLVITREAPMGEVCLIPEGLKCCLGQRQVLLRPDNDKIQSRYLLYALQSPYLQHQIGWNEGTGSTVSNLRIPVLEALRVPTPSLDAQREAAETLGALDDRITLLRETNATLEAIAQGLFKSWFVDFDPVRAKMEGRATEGMDEVTAALLPDSFEESVLGLVPRGWKVGLLSDLSELNPESWSAKSHPETVAYVDLANTKENVIAEISEFNFDEAPSRARRVLRDGDTIVGTVRPGNRSFAFISNASANLTGSTGFAVLRPTRKENTEFVYLTATASGSIEYLAHVADGGAYPAVRPEVVSGLQCVLPDVETLRAFHEVAEPIFAKVAGNDQQVQTLANLRDTLLPRLISGQLRLPEG